MTSPKDAKAKQQENAAGAQGAGPAEDSQAKAVAVGPTPCEVLGQHEVLAHEIVVGQGDKVDWRMHVCNTAGRAVLHLVHSSGQRRVLVDQTVPPPNPVTRGVMPPTPAAGRYVMIWALSPSGAQWQGVVEVLVNETVVFRQLKTHASDQPYLRGFLYVTVQ